MSSYEGSDTGLGAFRCRATKAPMLDSEPSDVGPRAFVCRSGRLRGPRQDMAYRAGGGMGGGIMLSGDTHAERSKKRYSSAFCCAVIGAPLHPAGTLFTWL